jgi:hypothetical protein
MSSHHFVKENQEPALFIANSSNVPYSVVEELLEWSPHVVVDYRAINEVLSWGIKIDVIIAHESKTKEVASIIKEQTPVKILTCAAEELQHETAMHYLARSKQNAVNIIGSVDNFEFLESFAELSISRLTSDTKWSFVRSGKFEKWLPANTSLSVRSGRNRSDIFAGEKLLHDQTLVTLSDGILSLRSDFGFWIGENIG